MSTETQEQTEMGPTKPVAEHAWLNNMVGEWTTEAEYTMGPDQPPMKSTGTESVRSLGGLWAFAHGKSTMHDGGEMEYFSSLGYDVSFKEYRGCWFAGVSSHLWNYHGTLSADQKTMTLDCEGPDMVNDGKTAKYQDIHEIVDANTRTMTSRSQGADGNWVSFMKVTYKRK